MIWNLRADVVQMVVANEAEVFKRLVEQSVATKPKLSCYALDDSLKNILP